MPATSRHNAFHAPVIENRLLSSADSAKEVRHLVFDLAGSGLEYRVGQSLGVHPTNDPSDVAALLHSGRFTGDELVTLPKAMETISLRLALLEHLCLGEPPRRALEAFLAVATHSGERAVLTDLLEPAHIVAAHTFLADRFFIDLFEEFPRAVITAQQLVGLMKKLQPRLYSIASSPKITLHTADLTVAVVRYVTNNHPRTGVCSSFLGDRLPTGSNAPVFVGDSPFRLTDDDAAPIIMVGPGTGLAPFRAFLQERAARRATGKNWLFFGDQHRECDFLYRDELLAARESGLLARLDLAWSRDQEKKIYVQDLMRQNAAELWQWLQDGAFFYVCGDATKMAKDVDAALHEVVSVHGCMDPPHAAEFISHMKKAGHYLRDVY